MVKVFALIPRRPDVTEEFFHEHWAGPHAELAKRITTIRRYVQSHRVAPGVAGLPPAIYEGIAEVWFDDFATAAGMGEDPNYAEGAHLDEPNFIDIDRLGFVIADEDVLRAGPPVGQDDAGVKAALLLRGGRAALAEAAARLADQVPAATRVTVSTAVDELYADGAEPAFDAIVELWFDDVAAFEAAWASASVADLGAADGSAGFLADELRVIWPQDVPATAA